MDYFRSRWSGSAASNNDTQPNQSQPVETPYNTVTFSNPHHLHSQQNPIIISSQHPSQISIIHEVRNTSLKAPEMTSPSDSFHSVASTYHHNDKGQVNMGFNGSRSEMNNQPNQGTQSNHPQNRVFHQTYWSWNWPWNNWNQREKIFLLIIVVLSLCILSLTSVLSVVVQKNVEYRQILFECLDIDV